MAMPGNEQIDANAKFRVGDKVRLNGRAPAYIIEGLRKRTRTVVRVGYSNSKQCTFYQLGDRGKSVLGYWFRSYMLVPANGKHHKVGRPRQKRIYRTNNHNSKVLLKSPNKNLSAVGTR